MFITVAHLCLLFFFLVGGIKFNRYTKKTKPVAHLVSFFFSSWDGNNEFVLNSQSIKEYALHCERGIYGCSCSLAFALLER